MNDTENGDMLISGQQRRLWALTYNCLQKFGCPVMFDFTKRNVPSGTEQNLIFFVPRQHLRLQEIKAYLFDELAADQSIGYEVAGTWIPGSTVHVLEFDGIDFYMTALEVENLLAGLKADFTNRLQPH